MAAVPASEPQLQRGLGLRTSTATSTGLAFSALNYLGAVTVALFVAGDAAWLAILIAGLLALLAAFAYGELNSLYLTFTYMSTIVMVIAADAFIVGRAIQYVLFPNQVLASFPIIAAMILAAVVANLRGVRIAGNVQDLATNSVLAITAAVSVVALAGHGFALTAPVTGHFTGKGGPLRAVVAGVFLFSAFEWVTTTSEEVRDPKLIPRAMLVGTGITALNTFNGGFLTASRFLYATAREGNLPRSFSRLNDMPCHMFRSCCWGSHRWSSPSSST